MSEPFPHREYEEGLIREGHNLQIETATVVELSGDEYRELKRKADLFDAASQHYAIRKIRNRDNSPGDGHYSNILHDSFFAAEESASAREILCGSVWEVMDVKLVQLGPSAAGRER